MALQAGELFATLTLDTSEFDRNFNEATNSVGTSGGMFEGLSALGVACFAKIGEAVSEVAGKVVDFVADSMGVFGDYEEQLNRVDVAMGGLTESEKTMIDDFIQSTAQSTRYGASEIAEVMKTLAKAGYEPAEAMEAIPTILNMATVNEEGLADTTNYLLDQFNSLGAGTAENMDTIADKTTYVSNKFKMSSDDIANAWKYVGSNTAMLNGGLEEQYKWFGLIADAGLNVSDNGDKLRNMENQLLAPTSKLNEQLESMGIQTRDTNGNLLDTQDVMAEFFQQLDQMSAVERDSILASVFNQEDLPFIQSMRSEMSGLGYDVDNLGVDFSNAGGLCKEGADKIGEGWNGAVAGTKSAIEALQLAVGKVFTHLFEPLLNAGKNAIVGITNIFNQIVAKLKLFIGEHQAAFEGIVRVIQPVMHTIKDIIGNVWDAIKGIFSAALDWIGALIDVFAGVLTGDWQMLWNGIKDMVGAAWDGIATAIEFVVDTIIDVIAGFVGSVVNKFSEMGSGAYNKVIEIKNNITNKFHELVHSAVGAIKELPNKIGGVFSDLASSAYDWGTNILQGLINGIESMIGSVWDKISSVASGIKDKVTGALGIHSPSRVFMEYGKFIDEGLALGIERSMGKVSNATGNLIAAATPDMNSANFSGANQTNVLDRLESILMGGGSARGSRDGVTYKSLFNIEHFENNRELDSEALMAEMATYIKASNRATGF